MSIDREQLLDVLDRAHEGPVCRDREWNMSLMPRAIASSMKRYGLENTFQPGAPVNTDDDLADRFFQAGLDTAVETGYLCSDTHRIIRFTRQEIVSAIEGAPATFWRGKGNQRVCYQHRCVEDTSTPVWTAPLSIAVTEDLFVPMVEAIARIPEVDALQGPSLETLWGRPLRSGSPYELLAGRYQADLMLKGLAAADREGMPLEAVGTSPTHYGVLGGFGFPDAYRADRDLVLILSLADLRTSFESLFKLAHAFNCGAEVVSAGSWSMIGGYAGGPEGTAISCIADSLLLFVTFQASRGGSFPFDIRYNGNTDRGGLWSLSIVIQALSRNTRLVVNSILNQVGGACTDMLLYESLVGMTSLAASGASACTGTRSSGGRLTNYFTPLEIKFGGEVFKAAAGLTRAQANEIANRFIPKYEGLLRRPPDGKSFRDCYDVGRLEPVEEWQALYDRVKEEAIQAGLPLR